MKSRSLCDQILIYIYLEAQEGKLDEIILGEFNGNHTSVEIETALEELRTNGDIDF